MSMTMYEEIKQRTAERRTKIACALIENGFFEEKNVFNEDDRFAFAEAVKNIERKLDS